MPITLDQYMINPTGNKAIFPAFTREAIRGNYTNRFNNLLLRENGKIDYWLYKDSKYNIYWIHIKIPSEIVPKLYYDVVFKFFTDSKVKQLGKSLEYYYIQLFSNDPSFVYNYAYTFQKNGLFIKELSSKMSKKALKMEAKEKNPQNINGYVKSVYFAYLFMKQRGLLKIVRFGEAEEFKIKPLLSKITHADDKILERQEEGIRINKKRKLVNKNTTYNISNIEQSNKFTAHSKSTNVNKTKRIKSLTNNHVKKTKRIK